MRLDPCSFLIDGAVSPLHVCLSPGRLTFLLPARPCPHSPFHSIRTSCVERSTNNKSASTYYPAKLKRTYAYVCLSRESERTNVLARHMLVLPSYRLRRFPLLALPPPSPPFLIALSTDQDSSLTQATNSTLNFLLRRPILESLPTTTNNSRTNEPRKTSSFWAFQVCIKSAYKCEL